MALVVIESAELQRLIEDAVASGVARAAGHDDWIDGRSSPMGHRAFLRLAREGAFPASLVGNKIIARRCAVDAYLDRERITPHAAPALAATAHGDCSDLEGAADPIARALAAGRLQLVKKRG